MNRNLYKKFILGYIAFALAAVVAIASFSSSLTQDYLIRSRSRTLYDEAMLIASACSNAYQGGDFDVEEMYPQLRVTATYLNSSIWVVDKEGLILVDSDYSKGSPFGQKAGFVIEGFDPVVNNGETYSTGTYFGMFPEGVLTVSAPITGNYMTHGYIIIHLPLNSVTESQNDILKLMYKTAAIIFGLSLLLIGLFHFTVYVPLNRLVRGAQEYSAGNVGYRIELNTNDEFGYLADAMNYMSSELGSTGQYQKDFIANISHDFRSPLTSIKGYLEAMLDGTIPPEAQEKYLKIVIGETERLAKLTSSLLTINASDAAGNIIRTPWDINRVIRDTAASFEGQCRGRNISFELTFAEGKEMVYADLGKIQQVLYNLIDNAIKFSDDDSDIYVTVSRRRDKYYISVRDTGIGIARKDINRVFDRFFKSDASRGKDKKGTGLGLAIVRDIIRAHGENIDVISTEGVGTEFIFSLPTYREEDAEE